MSIPSKWQIKSDSHNGRLAPSKRVFGHSTTRFETKLNTSPGPGHYKIESSSQSLIKQTPSISKKGYGNAFLSKTSKILDVSVHRKLIPGPGSYGSPTQFAPVKGAVTYHSDFREKGRQPFQISNEISPGPLDYKVNYEIGKSVFTENKPNASFASNTTRDSVDINSPAPGVGYYRVQHSAESTKTDYKWSKRTGHNLALGLSTSGAVGPGSYFDNSNEEEEQSARVMGKYRGPYLGKLHERPQTHPGVTFGYEKDRFYLSYMGKLDAISKLPGPGEHQPNNFCFDDKKHDDPPKSAIFKSKTIQHRIIDHTVQNPGPAYYNPSPGVVSKSHLQNMDGKWV